MPIDHPLIISSDLLAKHLGDPLWAIIDCRFDLTKTEEGEESYLAAHIPGAGYAHLDRDLSGPTTGQNGRHPLPDRQAMTVTFGRLGISSEHQVVAYDQSTSMFASRLWWMLRYAGHERAAVLDGGWAKWHHEGLPAHSGRELRKPTAFAPNWRQELLLDAKAVLKSLKEPGLKLLDARSAKRFDGSTESLDPIGGHIPGALNHPCQTNLRENGTFHDSAELRQRFKALLGSTPPEKIVSYCGSGVTACHNLLALARAGLDGGKLYPGSWSEWCSDPSRPVERSST